MLPPRSLHWLMLSRWGDSISVDNYTLGLMACFFDDSCLRHGLLTSTKLCVGSLSCPRLIMLIFFCCFNFLMWKHNKQRCGEQLSIWCPPRSRGCSWVSRSFWPVRRAGLLIHIASSPVNGHVACTDIHSVSISSSLKLCQVLWLWARRVWGWETQPSAVMTECFSRSEPRDLLKVSAEFPTLQLKSIVSCDPCEISWF